MAQMGPEAGIVISPMGIGEVLDTGFNLARRHYRWLLLITSWGAVPSYAVLAVTMAILFATLSPGGGLASILPFDPEFPEAPGLSQTGRNPSIPASLVLTVLAAMIALLVAVVGLTITSAAIMIGCGRIITPTGKPEEFTAGDVYGEAAGRFWGIFLLGLLYVGGFFLLVILSLTIIGFPIAVILGTYLSVRWSVAWPVVVLEQAGPVASVRRSWRLTRGSWWHTGVILVVSWLIIAVLSSVVGGILGGGGGLLGALTGSQLAGSVLNVVGQAVGSVLVEIFSVAILVVLYYELRARTEGFDLQQRGLQITQFP